MPYASLILIPAVVTLAITLLRLVGELMNWSPMFFNRAAGGGGAIVGIVWLIPVFGIYFALKLARSGAGPEKMGRAFGLVVLSLVPMPAAGIAANAAGIDPNSVTTLLFFVVAAIVAAFIAFRGWPELGRVLAVYGLSARIPVAIVMLIAILGDWGTHYDVPPPGFPEMAPFAKWFWIGLLPQLTIWIPFTMIIGMLFGLSATAITRRGRKQEA